VYWLFYVFFILSCILLLVFPKVTHHNAKDCPDNYYFFLLIPCLNEEKVIHKTVKHLLSMEAPYTTIIAIDDGSDDATLDILSSIQHPNFRIVKRDRTNTKKGKGMALNFGYHVVKKIVDELGIEHSKAIIGVMDADASIKVSMLYEVASIMCKDPKVGLVQSRIGISQCSSSLECLQDLEFFTIINRIQNFREYTGTVAAAGNGQFSRLSAMETLGNLPWSDCLLEDFDFSIRLLLNGWRTHLIQDEYTCQQGVHGYGRFIRQRARWAQGCIQCVSYLGKILRSRFLSIPGKIETSLF
jgi:cellulose synthase/poly-beta-1,6-N-acetylglucosamine synthase-like glycosyltransferase